MISNIFLQCLFKDVKFIEPQTEIITVANVGQVNVTFLSLILFETCHWKSFKLATWHVTQKLETELYRKL